MGWHAVCFSYLAELQHRRPDPLRSPAALLDEGSWHRSLRAHSWARKQQLIVLLCKLVHCFRHFYSSDGNMEGRAGGRGTTNISLLPWGTDVTAVRITRSEGLDEFPYQKGRAKQNAHLGFW